MSGHAIALARRQDLPEVMDVITSSFREEPLLDRLFPKLPRAEQVRRFRQLNLSNLDVFYQDSGFTHVARGEDGRILSAAVWKSPLAAGLRWSAFQRQLLPAAGASGWGRFLPSILEVEINYGCARPPYPHWYLCLLGTLDEARGSGVTSALMRRGLAIADSTHTPTYLEAAGEHLVPLYEHFGFRVTGRLPEVRGSHPVSMLRMPGQNAPVRPAAAPVAQHHEMSTTR